MEILKESRVQALALMLSPFLATVPPWTDHWSSQCYFPPNRNINHILIYLPVSYWEGHMMK